MTFLTNNLRQTVTHWERNAVDSSFDPSFATPVTLDGRWEDRTIKFIGRGGGELDSKAVVYLGSDVAIGDYLFKGTSTTADPTTVTDAHEVMDFRSIPSVKNTSIERRAIL